MVHPRPADATREAFYAWLVGKPYDAAVLPETLRAYEAWKLSREGEVPDVPFQMLTTLDLGEREWAAIAGAASWQSTRMNLNTFARHGVFKFSGMAEKLGLRKRLVAVRNTRAIRKKDLVHNSAQPRIEVDSQTYQVRADGELLVCEPAKVLPLAQRYFLF